MSGVIDFKLIELLSLNVVQPTLLLQKQELSLSFTQSAASRTMIYLALKNKLNFNIVALDGVKDAHPQPRGTTAFSRGDVSTNQQYNSAGKEKWSLFHRIFSNHIRANCEEGCSHNQKIGDILIAGSGVEIENRLLSSLAGRNESQVINIFHGGTYWIQDKPAFKEGEKLLCTDYFAYGAVQCQDRISPTEIFFRGVLKKPGMY